MKAQLTLGKPFIYALIVIISLSLIIIGYSFLQDITASAKEKELANFILTLDNNLKTHSSGPVYTYGSVDDKTFSLPSGIEEVCFADNSKEKNELASNELNPWLNSFPEHNLFIKPFDKFPPYKIGFLELEENPLCIKAVGGKLRLRLTSKGGLTQLSALAADDKDVDCVSIFFNKNHQESIDIVFLGYGYSTTESFASDANDYINNQFLNTEPFKSNKEKINFYRIDDFTDLGCEIKDWISCSEFKIKQLASQCPNDHIIVLVDRNKIKDMISPVRSSALSNTIKINTADRKTVLMHEFGHSFASLADEYVDNSYYKEFNEENYPNCDSTPCYKWQPLTEGCFKGCSTNAFFRPTKSSIMRSLKENSYGIVNENEINKRLDVYE
ncbi:hypothetical protein J4209_03715 [Candidatus Woesearchaeota archaeon]|nr:hypothetical protein [Candidatus Woesearchaeota archaeon]